MTLILESVYTSFILLFYALALVNVYKILHDELNPPAAAAWILLNLSIPFIGVPSYYFLGQNRLKSYVKRRRKIKPESTALHSKKILTEDRNLKKARTRGHLEPFSNFVSANEIQLLDDGTKAFSEIFKATSRAHNFILVQYYIFRPDSLGRAFKDILIERAQNGVAVFFIFDNLGSVGLTSQYIKELRKHGVHVARFLPFHLRFHLQINFRNHRKLVVIDGDVAFVGGMNVGDEYLGKRKFWRDTQIAIHGPAINELIEAFLDDWSFAASKHKRNLAVDTLDLSARPKALANSPSKGELVSTEVISFGPGDDTDVGLYVFMKLIQMAKKEIFIATPYFIPDLVLERCLDLALLSSVKITLLVPHKPDHRIIKIISKPYLSRMQRAGATVYLYKKGFMHQKVMLIDEQISVIGTSNFDNRSIYLNFETCIVTDGKTFAAEVKKMLERDISHAEVLQPKQHEGPLVTILTSLARLLAPLF